MNDVYVIVVEGQLDRNWSGWFDGFAITHNERGETTLSGRIADQSALHGLLDRMRDLGLCLVSLNRVDGSSESSETAS